LSRKTNGAQKRKTKKKAAPRGKARGGSVRKGKGEEAAKPTVTKALESFVRELDALADTLPLTMLLVTASIRSASEKLNAFLGQRCQKLSGGSFAIPPDEYNEFANLRRHLERNRRALQIIPRSFFTSLVSHYDAFTGSLLRSIFYLKPEVLNTSEHHITFKDLTTFGSLDDARNAVVEKDVEDIVRQSHADQFKWMETKLAVPLTKDLPSWPRFIEVTERRNLFVHCNGVVSAQYVTVCQRHGVDCSSVKLGSELHVSDKYFTQAYETILEVGIKLAHVLWRRLRPDELDDADGSLNNLCLDLIRDEKYSVARTLLDFAAGYKTFGSETARKVLTLNRAQAYKWSGQDRRAKEILKSEDWRAAAEKFQLGAAVLDDDFKAAATLMRHIGGNSSPNKSDYREWPIFKVFRGTSEFAQVYQEVFGEPFGKVTAREIADKKETGGAKDQVVQ